MDYTLVIILAILMAVYLYLRIRIKKQTRKNEEIRRKHQEMREEKNINRRKSHP